MSGSTMTYVHQRTTYRASLAANYHYESNANYRIADTYRASMSGTSYLHNSKMTSDGDTIASTAEQTGDSASSILQSVKEQEAQFERLTRELEAERRSVADQLEQCKVGSQNGSVRSLSSPALESHGYTDYIEQGAEISNLDNEGDNESSHLVDSCLRVLQERGIMQSDDVRGKSVAFDTRPDENHRYNGYTSRETTSVQSSRQNSYRQPEGGGMSRSQANYSLHSAAATDSYGSYSQLDKQADQQQWGQQQWDQPQNYEEYRDYREPFTDLNAAQLSEGDYIDSAAAASYINSYGDYHEDADPNVTSTNQPSYLSGHLPVDDYTQQAEANHTAQPQVNGDYIDQGSYRQIEVEQPSNFTQDYNGSGSSQDLVRAANHSASRDQFAHGYSRDQLAQGSSRDQLAQGSSRDQLYGSRDHVRDSREQLRSDSREPAAEMYPSSTNYEDYKELYPSTNPIGNNDRFNSFSDGPTYENTAPTELYGEEQTEPVGAYDERQLSYNEPSTPTSHPSHPMLADPNLLYGSSQSVSNAADSGQQWRPPDLPEVIEYLTHSNDAIKANAAAYLQHLCYGNNEIKTKTRTLRGIPALVNLLHNDIPEVHRNALGALLNLSRGYENDDNKKAIKSCGGIDSLSSLLERSRDNDVRELITGMLWNISSLGELKKSVISSALNPLVRSVILPAIGLSNRTHLESDISEISWSTEFRNATGVLRNVSSDGPYARKQLRECDGLLEALLKVTHSVKGAAEMDNKPVENVVCTLRNLSFRLMEVDYPDHYDKKTSGPPQTSNKPLVPDNSLLGCFGKSKQVTVADTEYPCRTEIGQGKGEQLWQKDLVYMYIPLISDCSNTDTLEAAVGAIQNLTACEWQPSKEFSKHMRKCRGLPKIVELLGLEEADNVVCGAAIALRNLAIDKTNCVLIGTYATKLLGSRLPPAGGRYAGDRSRASEETIRAVLAALYGVLKDRDADSLQHASILMNECEGLERLIFMSKSQRKYTSKTLRSVHQLLALLWRFTGLREVYRTKGYKESDFLSISLVPKMGGNTGTMSVASTLTRPRSEPPSNTNTIARSNVAFRDDESDERRNDPYFANYPSNGTLPIQRPYYPAQDDQPQDLHNPNYQTQASHTSNTMPGNDLYEPAPGTTTSYSYQAPTSNSYRQGSYSRQQSYDPSYPDVADNTNQPLSGSHQFGQSREGLLPNGQQDYSSSQNGQLQAEPLYARVDKRKSNNASGQTFINSGYNHNGTAISMESLNNYSFQASSQPNTSAGVDSWV